MQDYKLEPIHIFHKELSIDENDIFVVNLAEKNKVESVKLKKSREYAVTGLSINQDLDSKVIDVTDSGRLETINNLIRKLATEKNNRIFIFELEIKAL